MHKSGVIKCFSPKVIPGYISLNFFSNYKIFWVRKNHAIIFVNEFESRYSLFKAR